MADGKNEGLEKIIEAFHKRDMNAILNLSRSMSLEERLTCALDMAKANSLMESDAHGGRTWTFSRNEIRLVAGFCPCPGLGGIFGLPEDSAMKRWAKGDFVKMVLPAESDEGSAEEAAA